MIDQAPCNSWPDLNHQNTLPTRLDRAGQGLTQADLPQRAWAPSRLGWVVALQKASGHGVRTPVISDVLRRLVGRALAQGFVWHLQQTCFPHQCGDHRAACATDATLELSPRLPCLCTAAQSRNPLPGLHWGSGAEGPSPGLPLVPCCCCCESAGEITPKRREKKKPLTPTENATGADKKRAHARQPANLCSRARKHLSTAAVEHSYSRPVQQCAKAKATLNLQQSP